jgi:exodeoxyribonuclease V gamma subunit
MSHHLGVRHGRSDGICAAVRFPSPAALIAEVAGVQEVDLWAPDAAVWPLLEVIDASASQDWCRTLAAHLGYLTDVPDAAHRRGRRYAVARRVAGLFDGYATHRPDMLSAWAAGVDEDGWGAQVPPDVAWQPELWRRLRERIPAPDPVAQLQAMASRIEALIERCQRLAEENRSLRNQQEQLSGERSQLLAKNEQARTRVEAMIARLKSLEQHT